MCDYQLLLNFWLSHNKYYTMRSVTRKIITGIHVPIIIIKIYIQGINTEIYLPGWLEMGGWNASSLWTGPKENIMKIPFYLLKVSQCQNFKKKTLNINIISLKTGLDQVYAMPKNLKAYFLNFFVILIS